MAAKSQGGKGGQNWKPTVSPDEVLRLQIHGRLESKLEREITWEATWPNGRVSRGRFSIAQVAEARHQGARVLPEIPVYFPAEWVRTGEGHPWASPVEIAEAKAEVLTLRDKGLSEAFDRLVKEVWE